MATGSPVAAQACGLTITGDFAATATIDAASGEFVIEAPVAFGDALNASTPIALDAAARDTGSFDVSGDFDLSSASTQLTWTVTTGELTINEADQEGPLELTAELVASSEDETATGTMQLTATASVVDLVQQPTPLEIKGAVSGAIACGDAGAAQTPTEPTSPTTGAGSAPANDPTVVSADDNLATTGIGPTLLVLGLLTLIGGAGAVVHGLGRVRFKRWFPT